MKIAIPENKKLVYETEFPLRWGDMDAMGHVNNTMYFRFMESARVDWLTQMEPRDKPEDQGPAVVSVFCNYYRQLVYPDQILLKMYASDAARTTFETWVTMERVAEPGVIYAAGGATVIWVDMARQKAAELPQWVRAVVSAPPEGK